ncbi:MAG TPA: 16S rRNA (cytosine(1402)-N(4))-methyltransferase RsmH [Candidatus Paceibacterota bacterium]
MRTRRSQSSSDPVSSSLDVARDKSPYWPTTASGGSAHKTVLLHEAVEALSISPEDIVVDATLGGGGHAQEIVARLRRGGVFVGFDLDQDAVRRAEARLKGSDAQVVLINANFRNLGAELRARGIERIDAALFDLGWSADQLASGRGFSFLSEEPLLMTYGHDQDSLTAGTIVNEWAEESIADILFGWGEERYSRKIARAIVLRRAVKPFTTSRDLATVIQEATPLEYRRRRIHPATKTFQAIRIAVNDELGALAEGLKGAWDVLSPSGRLAVITFHSIEDRLVKQRFVGWERTGEGIRVNKKPLTPSDEELKDNPRVRSAKLRVIEKI